MLVIGLTGGIGSGKTTVANLFAKYGVPIIDADVIARDVIAPGQPALLDVIDHFAQPLLQDDGSINRHKLREIVFTHPEERVWLENLLHPLIRDEIARQVKAVDHPYCIVVIPLLLESKYPYTFIDRILIIDTIPQLQIARAAERDGKHPDSIQAIMDTQINRQDRLTQAHDIIINNGDLKELEQKVAEQHKIYSKMNK